MGRKTILEKKQLTLAEIERILEEEPNEDAAAARLECTSRTLRNYISHFGLRYTRKLPGHYGCLARWVRSHAGTVLPRSVHNISQLTECSEDAVVSYLARRKRTIRDRLRRMGDLRKTDAVFRDRNGHRLPAKWWRSYTVRIDRFDLSIDIYARVKTGTDIIIHTTWEEIQQCCHSQT